MSRQPAILVFGDLMLDEFIRGRVRRISPEAPVPVLEVEEEHWVLGGAGNVVNNLVALGAKVGEVGVVGDDTFGRLLNETLEEKGVDTRGLVVDLTRPTIRKTRVIAHHQQVVRVDRESKAPLSDRVRGDLVEQLTAMADGWDAVIVSDYGKGVIEKQSLPAIIAAFRAQGAIVAIDPKPQNMAAYLGATFLTPNHFEAGQMAGVEMENDAEVEQQGMALRKTLQCDDLLITRGERGMSLLLDDGIHHLPTVAQEVFDVTGAGDTVISVMTYFLAQGKSPLEAARLANIAGGIVVGKLGTATVTVDEIMAHESAS